MLSSDKITKTFFVIDEFCKNFNEVVSAHTIKQDNGKKTRNRKSILSDSEVMTILILFHSGGYKNLKHFYIYYVQKHMKMDVETGRVYTEEEFFGEEEEEKPKTTTFRGKTYTEEEWKAFEQEQWEKYQANRNHKSFWERLFG